MLVSHKRQPKETGLTHIKTGNFDVQSAVSKREKVPLENIQKVTQDLRRYIPRQETCKEETKEYYQEILRGGQDLHTVALNTELKMDEVERDLQGVLKQCKFLASQLQIYKDNCYQQKFDVTQFSVVLGRIANYTSSLTEIDLDLKKIQASVNSIKLDSDPTKHLDQELDKDDLNKYLEVSEAEVKRSEEYKEFSKQLQDVNETIHKKELELKESTKKIEKLEENIAKLRERIKGIEIMIQEKEKFVQNYANTSEQLKISSHDGYESNLRISREKGEKQREIMEELRKKKNDVIEEMLTNLNQQVSKNSATNPLIHHILVLDQSGSMKGQRWNELIKAVEIFVKQNKSQASDLLSVITFDNTATEVMKKIKFSDYRTPTTKKWGGTNFDAAFTMARDISKLSRTHRPVVVFLTDGDGTMRETPKILREMNAQHKEKGFMFFSIGVGDDYKIETLRNITRIANDGNLFVDLGDERIEFVHTTTTQDEKFLENVFTKISNGLNTFPLKIMAAIETLKKQRIESDEEARRQYEFDTSISDQELEEIRKKQQDLLERRIKVLEEKNQEEKSQIDFFKNEIKEINQEIETLEAKLKNEPQLVVPEDIANLKETRKNIEEKKKNAWEAIKKLSDERDVVLDDLHKSKANKNMSTLMQLFDFLRTKEKAKTLKDNHYIYLGKVRSLIRLIIDENAVIEESLKTTTAALSHLEDDGILDIVFEHYQNLVEIEQTQDAVNFRKIARYILEIKEEDGEGLEALESLMTCLQPRNFLSPMIVDEDRKNIISSFIDGKWRFEIERLDAAYQRYNQDWKAFNVKFQDAEAELKKLKKEIEELKEKKPKKEREVKKLKTRINKSQRKDEDDKENVKRNRNIENEESDEDDEKESELEVALEKLQEIEKQIQDKKSKKESIKKNLQYFNERLNKLLAQKYEVDTQKSEKERERERVKSKILSFHSRLKIELMTRVNRYLKDTNYTKIEGFEDYLMESLVTPIKDYFI